jgi:hypothetical protein
MYDESVFDLKKYVLSSTVYTVGTRQRRHLDDLVSSLSQAFNRWKGLHGNLNAESTLQQLDGISHDEATNFCRAVEDCILDAGDCIEFLAHGAYDTLMAIGYDCSAWEWAALADDVKCPICKDGFVDYGSYVATCGFCDGHGHAQVSREAALV